MKTRLIRNIMAIAVIAVMGVALTGCETTGGVQQAGSDFWNSPAVQAELAFLEKIGTDALNAWIQSQLPEHPRAGAKREDGRSKIGKEEAIRKAIAKAEVKCPDIPRDTVEKVIRQKFTGR